MWYVLLSKFIQGTYISNCKEGFRLMIFPKRENREEGQSRDHVFAPWPRPESCRATELNDFREHHSH